MVSCLILAAGQGKRLNPLTLKKPKALITFLDKPLIMHQINIIESLGINNIAIVTGYLRDQLEGLGYTTYHNKEYENTNMVYSLFCGVQYLKERDDDLIISYGDIVYEKKNLESLIETDGDIVVMVDDNWLDLWSLRNENPLLDAETMKFDDKGYISELGGKAKNLLEIESQYTGLIKISNKVINPLISFYYELDPNKIYNGKSFNQIYLTDFLQLLIKSGWKIKPAHVSGGWLEIDTIEDLRLYEKLNNENSLDFLWNKNE